MASRPDPSRHASGAFRTLSRHASGAFRKPQGAE